MSSLLSVHKSQQLPLQFPDWLAENKEKLSEDDFKRYSKQHELVDQVCGYYEEAKDVEGPIENKRFQKILTAMQEMQQCGQPPEALVANGENPTGFQSSSNPMDDFNELNKMMGEGGNMDQCKTM